MTQGLTRWPLSTEAVDPSKPEDILFEEAAP